MITTIRQLFTILFVEWRESIKIIDKCNVVPLHNDTCGDEGAPCDRFGVELDTLQEGHVMLLVCSRLGKLDNLGVAIRRFMKDFLVNFLDLLCSHPGEGLSKAALREAWNMGLIFNTSAAVKDLGEEIGRYILPPRKSFTQRRMEWGFILTASRTITPTVLFVS